MRILPALLVVLLFAACGPTDREATPDVATTDPGPTVAEFAGTWDNVVTLEGVEEPVHTQLEASSDGSEWALILEGRDPVPLTASVVGDSLITESEPYESILRPGVTTRVRSAAVLRGETMVGTARVTYSTDAGEEVVRGTTRATRVR